MLAAVFHDTASADQCCNLTPVTSVTTFKNWWQLGFHPKFAIDTLSFYSVPMFRPDLSRYRWSIDAQSGDFICIYNFKPSA